MKSLKFDKMILEKVLNHVRKISKVWKLKGNNWIEVKGSIMGWKKVFRRSKDVMNWW